jgi:hypothetical protein
MSEFTPEQNQNLTARTDELMRHMHGKLPDMNTLNAMKMLANVFMNNVKAVDPELAEREGLMGAIEGAAFVAAIGRDESVAPFEYLKIMALALFSEPSEAYGAKLKMYDDAIACVKAGKHVAAISIPERNTDEGAES